MKILIATPLYPPDIAGHAPYVKELAARLKNEHEISILAYNHIPEKVAGVTIIAIDKHLPLPVRISRYTLALLREARKADVVYVQNGASTELPMLIVSKLTKTPFVLRLGDTVPLENAARNTWHKVLLHAAVNAADKVALHENTTSITQKLMKKFAPKLLTISRPLARPEILPFAPYPLPAFEAYESSWAQHVNNLRTLL